MTEYDFGVVPTPQRKDVDPRYTGRGVTIAMIDSGFFPHPDLMNPQNRVLAFHDPSGECAELEDNPDWWKWHGTMTTVVATGSGYISGGRFPGIARDASVVLVKAGYQGRILEDNVAKSIEWVLRHREQYNIRVMNISLGTGEDDIDKSFTQDRVNVLAERAIEMGITVVVAAGNSLERTIPPASSPSVISVGGYENDNWTPDDARLYHSAFGLTADAVLKPEVIAPAEMVAVPILPNTPQYAQAEALSALREWPARVRELWQQAQLPEWVLGAGEDDVRREVEQRMRANKYVGYNFQHGEGTSFASPIVSSIVAQMLEANPALQPHQIKNILVSSADRLQNAEAIRQGYGVVNARRAIDLALRAVSSEVRGTYLAPTVMGGRLVFWYTNPDARSVAVAGDFNGWQHDPMEKYSGTTWRAALPLPGPGKYAYKYLVDGSTWVEDPNNGHRESDPYGGLNSIVTLEAPPPPPVRTRGSARAAWLQMALKQGQ